MSRNAFSREDKEARARWRLRLAKRTAPCSFALAALATACEGRDVSAFDASASLGADAPGSQGREARPLEASVAERLAEASVTDVSYARRVLWSWTSRKQAARLRRETHLLLETELPEGPTPYVHLLERVVAEGGGPHSDMARLLLLHPSLRLRRYAWARPWPTRLGLAERDYGDQLLRVVLAPTAVIARFDPTRPAPFEFRDLDGRAISVGQVLADPSVLAAVYHVRASDESAVAYREYVLCNEAMVAEWSLATPETASAIAEDRALAAALASADLLPSAAHPHWKLAPLAGTDGASLYGSALAFDNERYRSTPGNLRDLEDALERAEQIGPPLVVVPRVAFARDAHVPEVRMRKLPMRVRAVV